MTTKLVYLILMIAFCSCNSNKKQVSQVNEDVDNTMMGKWIRTGQTEQYSFDFKENGFVEGDFGNDRTIDVVANYKLSGDTIKFIDIEGKTCPGVGQYKFYQTKYYVSFELIDDDCGGRIHTIMGFWTKPNFSDLIKELDEEIENSPAPDLYLSRARINLATGMTNAAKDDLDSYLLTDTLDARVYINRAGTRFPDDLKGVISDCNKAMLLDPNNKNAYFLRGLARYELGEKKQGCEDFSKAIELGFSILKIAEQKRCIDFWDN